MLTGIRAFLSDHTQQVGVDGARSNVAQETSGVPQSTVHGPILVLIFINDMLRQLHTGTHLFAEHLSRLRKTMGNGIPPAKMQCSLLHKIKKTCCL